MNKLFVILFFLIIGNWTKLFSQTIESAEIPLIKNRNIKFLGESDGKAYFYGNEIHKNIIMLTIYKFNPKNLELIDTNVVFIKEFAPKVFNNNTGKCKVEAIYKNNKFYFFYSLIQAHDYYIYLKTFDESLTNEKTIELGTIVETGYEYKGNFFVTINPNCKNALVILKNFCERKKAVGSNTEIYEKTELINYDLINNKTVFTKNIPIDLGEYRLKTEQYKFDNEGNISCMASTAERQGQYDVIHSLAVGYLEKNSEKITFMNVDLTGIVTLSASFKQLINGDLLYIIASEKSITIKYICPKDQTKNFVKQISSASFQNVKKEFHVSDISEASNGFYLTLKSNRYNNYGFSSFKEYGVAYISKVGELLWSKSFQLIAPLFYDPITDFYSSSVVKDNKLHFFYLENKPYEMTNKIQKQVKEEITNAVYDLRKFNTIESTVDEKGAITKKVICDNETYELNPNLDEKITIGESVYFPTIFKKNFQIKKVVLK